MTFEQQCQLALEHQQAGRLREAEALYRDALAQRPDEPEVLHLLGVVLAQTGRHDEGVEFIRRAIAIRPAEVKYHINLALACRRIDRFEDAVAAYRKAIALAPDSVRAYNGLGMSLAALNRHDEAADAFRRAIELAGAAGQGGATAEMFGYLGASLWEIARLDEALAAFQQAVARNPQLADAHSGIGNIQWRLGLVDESLATLRTALRIRPTADYHSALLFSMQFSPRETAESIYAEHRRFDKTYARPLASQIRPHDNDRDPQRRLRVGYVSADFRDHVLALYTTPLLRAHDRAQVEVFCYSHVPRADAVTDRIRARADVWRDTTRLSDDQAAALIRADAIDVLVDLNMHMTHARPLIFARKPAPVQVAWLAYPGTTGLSAMDYRLSDPHLDPPGTEAGKYAETTLRLPQTFWCFDPMSGGEPVADPPVLRNGYVTFGCLNNFAKVNDDVLALWSRVMHATTTATAGAGARSAPSRLYLLAPPGAARTRVVERLDALGIDAARIEFADHARRRPYLRHYNHIDIALDTVPYNGHTTSMDAMWMGVPVVTLIGATVVGRAGLSQLTNLDLSDLAAPDEADFIRIATELAADIPRLRELRGSLRERMRASPLVDTALFARSMEAAFRTMWRRWCGVSA